MKKAILIALVFYISLASLASIHATPSDFYITSIEPITFEPGKYYNLSITLKNLGTDFATQVKAFLDNEDTSPIDPIGATKSYLVKKAQEAFESQEYFGAVLQNQEITFTYSVYVDEDAKKGTYYVPLEIKFLDPEMNENSQTLYFGVNIIPKSELVISGINTSPARIHPDDDFTLKIEIENIGSGEAKAVALNLKFPEEFSGENSAFLGAVQKDSTKSAEFELRVSKNALPKAYNFTLEITFKDDEGAKKIEKSFKVFVLERGSIDIEIAGVSTSPAKIYPGSSFTLSVQLENIGKQEAKAIKAVLEPAKGFMGERTSFVGSLKEDDLSTAIFEMQTSKELLPGSYTMKMKIYYIDERGQEYEEEKEFELILLESPKKSYKFIVIPLILIVGIAYYLRRRKHE